jgi:type IV secretion system protein VirB9
MRKIVMILLLIGLLPTGYALIMPIDMKTDPRIKTVRFVQHQIVPLTISQKILTQIHFSSDEQIIQVVFGDLGYRKDWPYLVPKNVPNVLFLGTTLASGETNMTVITNEHTYYFDIQKKASELADDITYSLVFQYPKDNSELAPTANLLSQALAQKSGLNFNYRYSGSTDLKPVRVFDNGVMTFITFKQHVPLPSIEQVVDAMGHEQIVNTRVEGRTIIIMNTGEQFTLRQGGVQVGSLLNEQAIHAQVHAGGQQYDTGVMADNKQGDAYLW